MSATPSPEVIESLKQKEVADMLSQGKRVDGRGLLEYREIKVEDGGLEKAHGSAVVTIGKTKVLASVKTEVASPFPDTPSEGILIVNVELIPFAKPYFGFAHPDEEAVELARVVDKSLRGSQAIDLAGLCIKPGEQVISIFIDLYTLNHDGNLVDTAMLATLKALKNTTIPAIPGFSGEPKPLKLQNSPLNVSFAKIGDKMVVDPSLVEERVAQVKLSIGIDERGNVCSIQKSGPGTISLIEAREAVNTAIEKARGLLKLL
jgi:exosome complex component RRP42